MDSDLELRRCSVSYLLLALASLLSMWVARHTQTRQRRLPARERRAGADPALFTVDHPEQFPVITAVERPTTSELVVTGTVTPDVARNVPVVSLASGRVVAIHARLGDTVKKGSCC